MIKTLVKKLIPLRLLNLLRPWYHGALAYLACWYYGSPSARLTVIGVTGTAGKSTTSAMLSEIFNAAGIKCGYMTTVNFFDGENNEINKHGMSMPGGPRLQRQLKQMADNGCKFAIVECTSEGLAQNRHAGIKFTAALLTNLSSAHLEAHGSFENYRAAKAKLFKHVEMIGVNLDSPEIDYFLDFPAEQKFGVSFVGSVVSVQKIFRATEISGGFELNGQKFTLALPGEFNLRNAALAASCANTFGVELSAAAEALRGFSGIHGRMELVPNNRQLAIVVDYGCEPVSIRAALAAADAMPHRRLIHVFGATGGHRDKFKRRDFGQASAAWADISIVTNDDVYDSDPQEIVDATVQGILEAPQRKPKNQYFIKLDRSQAIAQAITMAEPGDLVLITGKGSEQFLVLPGNRRISWDDREAVKTALAGL